MANAKPYLTTDGLVAAIQRKVAMPISQNLYTYNDFVDFLNEELQLNAVPSIKLTHEEFFVYDKLYPMINGIGQYSIPNRAMGMVLRDLNYVDASGNYSHMAKIAEEDRAYFQQSLGSNQVVGKYYVKGNDIVLAPQISTGATGSLMFSIFLRPNFLVRDDRAAIIQNFQKPITVNNATISVGDTITIQSSNLTQSPVITIFTATSGTPVGNEFLIGGTSTATATNLAAAITAAGIEDVSSASVGAVVTVTYSDITITFTETSTTQGSISPDNTYVYIQFDQLPTSYTDPDTNVTSTLYSVGGKVDFLQTNPGHKTYNFDVKLRAINTGNVGKFLATDLQTYLNNSGAAPMQFWPMEIGDYICLANECIIPQIPPELHSALAERAASEMLRGMGDKDGYEMSQNKIAQMNVNQGTLLDTRVEGSVTKVFNSSSLLRMGKRLVRRF